MTRVGMLMSLALMIGCTSTAGAQDGPNAKAADSPPVQQVEGLIVSAQAGYPTPATPYYHYRLKLDLPRATQLDATVWIDGQKQRKIELFNEEPEHDRPLIHYRPPFANTYVVDSRVYDDPLVKGWLPWQPGESYEIRLRVRTRQDVKARDEDDVLEQTVTLTGPADAQVFDPAWKDYKAVVLSETAGVDRSAEPVELVLAFYADQAQNLADAVRVVAVDPETHAVTEVPSQVLEIKHDVRTTDQGAVDEAVRHPGVPIWVPTVTARVAFLARAPARKSRVYLIYHNNPDASPPEYETDLKAAGPNPGLLVDAEDKVVQKPRFTIQNDKIEVRLHPLAGVLDELALKSRPEHELFHHMETNGAIHWSPEAYPPPRPWAHMSDWKEPKFEVARGPVMVQTHASGPMPYVPEVNASVSYRVYAGLPYIKTETSMRVEEALAVQALRNGEVVFKRGLLTHVAWYDVVRDKVQTYDLETLADLDELLMDKDVPWITFYNPQTRIAFGGIQLNSSNAGLEHRPRVLNPYHYVIVGPVIYWARAMNFTFASSASQLMVEAPKGSLFWEEWAFVLYEPAAGDEPYAPLLQWERKLTNPLRVRLVEEVEPRVPTVGTEIYIDPSRTGWEERDTLRED